MTKRTPDESGLVPDSKPKLRPKKGPDNTQTVNRDADDTVKETVDELVEDAKARAHEQFAASVPGTGMVETIRGLKFNPKVSSVRVDAKHLKDTSKCSPAKIAIEICAQKHKNQCLHKHAVSLGILTIFAKPAVEEQKRLEAELADKDAVLSGVGTTLEWVRGDQQMRWWTKFHIAYCIGGVAALHAAAFYFMNDYLAVIDPDSEFDQFAGAVPVVFQFCIAAVLANLFIKTTAIRKTLKERIRTWAAIVGSIVGMAGYAQYVTRGDTSMVPMTFEAAQAYTGGMSIGRHVTEFLGFTGRLCGEVLLSSVLMTWAYEAFDSHGTRHMKKHPAVKTLKKERREIAKALGDVNAFIAKMKAFAQALIAEIEAGYEVIQSKLGGQHDEKLAINAPELEAANATLSND